MDRNSCRVCSEKSRRMKSMFDSESKFDVASFIKEFCNVLITEDDEFTKNVCRKCFDKIQLSYELRARCIESDRRLRQNPSEYLTHLPSDLPSEFLLPSYNAIKEETLDNLKGFDLSLNTCEEEKSALNLSMPSFDSFTNISESVLHQQTITVGDLSKTPSKASKLDDNESRRVKNAVSKNHEKTHMCSVCGKTFFTSGHLRSHELTHKNSKAFTCHSCDKKFLTKSYLNRHMKSHLNERSYKCKVCQKGFNTSTSLGYHFRLVHSGETNYICTFCNKGFPLKIQLISHTRSHSGEKPHKCDQCDKKYSHKIDLKRHMMLHTGNKPYKCPHCERTFTKKSNMECHIPTHTGEKPYKCDVCFKEFRQPCPYKKHLQTHLKLNGDRIEPETVETNRSTTIS